MNRTKTRTQWSSIFLICAALLACILFAGCAPGFLASNDGGGGTETGNPKYESGFDWSEGTAKPYDEPEGTQGTILKKGESEFEIYFKELLESYAPERIMWYKYQLDSDSDGFNDGVEVDEGTDPEDPADYPDVTEDINRDGYTLYEKEENAAEEFIPYKPYIDSDIEIRTDCFPGKWMIKTAQADRVATDSPFLTFACNKTAYLYLCFDSRMVDSLPEWTETFNGYLYKWNTVTAENGAGDQFEYTVYVFYVQAGDTVELGPLGEENSEYNMYFAGVWSIGSLRESGSGDPGVVPREQVYELHYAGDDAEDDEPFEGGGSVGDTYSDESHDYSTTNVQEEDVDEADVVKTDGSYIYRVSEGAVHIVRAWPASQVAEVSAIEFSGMNPNNIYLTDDKHLIIVSQADSYPIDSARNAAATAISVYDVSVPTTPVFKSENVFEGAVVSTRRIGSNIYLVLKNYLNTNKYTAQFRFTYSDGETVDEVMAENQAVIDNADAAGVLPLMKETVSGKASTMFGPESVYLPPDPDNRWLASVVTIDISSALPEISARAILSNGHEIYCSREALYLVGYGYSYYSGQTVIHKFALKGEVEYTASGSVRGQILNQYSLSEYKNTLRIATSPGWSLHGSSVYCLQNHDGELKTVGSIEGIKPGEHLYSARFVEDRGYLVTFKKVDPLFTLDLSDPEAPELVGELKVPGFSGYLHPMGRNHVLGIGHDSENVGGTDWFQGVQLSLFDVSVFDNPLLLDKVIIGTRGTTSEAVMDPKAFTYWRDQSLLAIPVDVCEGGTGGSDIGEGTFAGLYVYRVSAYSGFEYTGRISSGESASPSWWSSNTKTRRGIFIGDNVYLTTPTLIRATKALTPNEEGEYEVELK